MIILPAIDIIDRKPVRLYQGDYAQKEIVGSSVMELAKNFEQSGAEYIHLVDLDGAKEGVTGFGQLCRPGIYAGRRKVFLEG